MVLETFLDERHQRMCFNVARKREGLRVGVPSALERDSSVAMTCARAWLEGELGRGRGSKDRRGATRRRPDGGTSPRNELDMEIKSFHRESHSRIRARANPSDCYTPDS